jgi:hypothetical protein
VCDSTVEYFDRWFAAAEAPGDIADQTGRTICVCLGRFIVGPCSEADVPPG